MSLVMQLATMIWIQQVLLYWCLIQEIIELMEENNVTTAYIDWTVYALDNADTLEAENAPFSLIVNGENALASFEEELIPTQFALHKTILIHLIL